MENHEGMSMPGDKKGQKKKAPAAGKVKKTVATKQKSGHEGHDMPAKPKDAGK